MSIIKVHLEHPNAKIPERSYGTSACYDLFCAEDLVLEPGESAFAEIGLRLMIPDNYYVQFRSRSGLAIKKNVLAFPGVLDAGYSGPCALKLTNHGIETVIIQTGQACGQMEVCRLIDEAVSLDQIDDEAWDQYHKNSERGKNGFGSTTK